MHSATPCPCVRSVRIIRQDILVDGASGSPRECVVDDDVDVLERGQRLWCFDFAADTNIIDVFIGYLRRKLESAGAPELLHTVRGVGLALRAR
jgi:hypothetical protein